MVRCIVDRLDASVDVRCIVDRLDASVDVTASSRAGNAICNERCVNLSKINLLERAWFIATEARENQDEQ
jgi:hypothetical protein